MYRSAQFEQPATRQRSPMTKILHKRQDLNLPDRRIARFEKSDQKEQVKLNRALRLQTGKIGASLTPIHKPASKPLMRNIRDFGKRIRISTAFDEFQNELNLFPSGFGFAGTPNGRSQTFGIQISKRASQSPAPKQAAPLPGCA